MPASARRALGWLAAAGALAGGCNGSRQAAAIRRDLQDARDQVQQLRRRNAELRQALRSRQEHIETLQALGDRRLDRLFHVRRIRLGRYTGGANLDDAPGDDGVRVYLQPMDQDGGIIKAAGEVTVQLYDLAADPNARLVFEKTWAVAEIGERWSGGLLSPHYSFACRWRRPPDHDELTVRVRFVDYLTGKTFTAQKLVTVDLPPEPAP
jgi:hypothetical protein